MEYEIHLYKSPFSLQSSSSGQFQAQTDFYVGKNRLQSCFCSSYLQDKTPVHSQCRTRTKHKEDLFMQKQIWNWTMETGSEVICWKYLIELKGKQDDLNNSVHTHILNLYIIQNETVTVTLSLFLHLLYTKKKICLPGITCICFTFICFQLHFEWMQLLPGLLYIQWQRFGLFF